MAVGTGQIGYGEDRTLAPKLGIRKARDVAHMDSGADDSAALADCSQRGWDEGSDRRKDDGGVERNRRGLVRSPRPDAAKGSGERLTGIVSRLGEGEHFASLPGGDLSDDVRGRAKAVEAEPTSLSSHHQRSIADQAGAEQRRRLRVVEGVRNGKAVAGIRHDMRRIAAVAAGAREDRPVTQILTASMTIAT